LVDLPLSAFLRERNKSALERVPAGWLGLLAELAAVQDAAAVARPSPAAAAVAAELLARAKGVLDAEEVPDDEQIFGRLMQHPGRGQTLSPPLYATSWTTEELRGHITFGSFYKGSRGAVFGGAVAMFLDDALGLVANMSDLREHARTASLTIDYRSVTPVGKRLDLQVRVAEVDGRKRWLRGVLSDGDRVCAEANGLWIAQRPQAT
jgi:acyl-coenzyme A thioesterase PaaI-like protein